MKVFGIFFLVSFGIFAEAGARPEVIVPPQVEVSQRGVLRLGDIAALKQADLSLFHFLDEVVLREDARELVLQNKITAVEILNKVKQTLAKHEDLKKIQPQFNIPSQVEILFSKDKISNQELSRRIENYALTKCPECEFKSSISKTPVPLRADWDLDLSNFQPKGGFIIPLKDGSDAPKWVSGAMRVLQQAPVASRVIPNGERLQSSDFSFKWVDVTYVKDAIPTESQLIGMMSSRSLPMGTTILISDLKREPAVKKGQTMKALLGDETFEISLQVTAEDNGFVGDLIKVKNLDTQKFMSGLVIEKGVVRLQ